MEVGLPLILLLIGVLLFCLIFWAVGEMAKDRGHSPWPWWIVSVFWSPFGSMVVLWLFFDILDDK
ncbi:MULTISPECIES: hypothetical protein [unclassified Ruegeria]|uniref:hypothetical protein n=1 Tax=unclassified Ruegeria TaxID=2625375 RepID=UPI001490EE02|nr:MULTISPECIES: hypothetical protein [unclassified Ruegeria]NOD88372.1 hypothetical protein [Ruegeria sp. HKCCD4318]NOE13281.1 hypothetical protein [Ruegeria sp. HKCCD4318-2]NOG11177.1 hypothetical protein [Ruegeria sp. HKCCD4315]